MYLHHFLLVHHFRDLRPSLRRWFHRQSHTRHVNTPMKMEIHDAMTLSIFPHYVYYFRNTNKIFYRPRHIFQTSDESTHEYQYRTVAPIAYRQRSGWIKVVSGQLRPQTSLIYDTKPSGRNQQAITWEAIWRVTIVCLCLYGLFNVLGYEDICKDLSEWRRKKLPTNQDHLNYKYYLQDTFIYIKLLLKYC